MTTECIYLRWSPDEKWNLVVDVVALLLGQPLHLVRQAQLMDGAHSRAVEKRLLEDAQPCTAHFVEAFCLACSTYV